MANANIIYSQFDFEALSRREQLALLDSYYGNNDLYEATRILKYYMSVWNEDIRPLRTPVNRSVEFFVSKIAIGDGVISAKNKSRTLVDSVSSVLEWSNFQIQKPLQIRKMSLHGDLFRKVVSANGKVWHEVIETADVTSFEEDARGFLNEIRIDTPIIEDGIQKTRTELWTVNANVPYMAIWIHRMGEDATMEQIQNAVDPTFFAPLTVFGIDFVPFVRSPFRNVGTNKNGASCVQHALLKVDEANRQATRLHQMLFRYNKPLWAVSSNMTMEDGTPLPPPKVASGGNGGKDMELRDNSILYLSGLTTIEGLVPNIDYKGALEILLSEEKELEKDLPELLYYSIPENADMSGKAIRTLLGAAVDRATQAQTNYVEGTVRLNQMAITVGQFQGIFPSTLGTFDGGELAHSIRFDEPFPQDGQEKATTLATYVTANMPLKLAMQFSGFSEEEINKVPDVQPTVQPVSSNVQA